MNPLQRSEGNLRKTMDGVLASLLRGSVSMPVPAAAVDGILQAVGDSPSPEVQRIFAETFGPRADDLAGARRRVLVFASAMKRLEDAAREASEGAS